MGFGLFILPGNLGATPFLPPRVIARIPPCMVEDIAELSALPP
jgi:hypothetical protein